jgi:hypothetical protein
MKKQKTAPAAASPKVLTANNSQTLPVAVADYLYKLPVSALTDREKSELWNACGALIGRLKDKPFIVQEAQKGSDKEVRLGKANSAR